VRQDGVALAQRQVGAEKDLHLAKTGLGNAREVGHGPFQHRVADGRARWASRPAGSAGIVMSKRWKMLGPLEAVNGVLMLGMTCDALVVILTQLKGQRRALGAR
jgi:hypothetical protein